MEETATKSAMTKVLMKRNERVRHKREREREKYNAVQEKRGFAKEGPNKQCILAFFLYPHTKSKICLD